MSRSSKDLIEISYQGNGVFIKISKSLPEDEPLPFGKVTEYIQSQKFLDVDFVSIKKAYKNAGGDPVRFARRLVDLGYRSRFKINISEDKMLCNIILLPPRDKEQMIGSDMVLSDLKKRKVTYGIKESEIKEGIDNKIFRKKIVAAEGKMPILGREARIKPLVPCKMDLDGLSDARSSEDFMNSIELIEMVQPDDIIAEIETATKGESGLTIYGEKILTLPGEILGITGSNVRVDEIKIIAETDGRVIFNSEKIDIEPVMIALNAEKGEIRFDGSIKIMGDIQSYPLIQASGDIEVHGIVSDTRMVAGRNIFIHGSLIGDPGKTVIAEGDFAAQNVSNATIKAKNIFVYSGILNSDITAYKSVHTMSDMGSIVGGNTFAGYSISSKFIGNEMRITTKVSVATPEAMLKHRNKILTPYIYRINGLKKEKESILKKIDNVEKLKNRPDVKEPVIYNCLLNSLQTELAKKEDAISGVYKEVVKVKDPKCESVSAFIKANRFYPGAILALGIGSRKINERKEGVRYCVENSNIFSELLDKKVS